MKPTVHDLKTVDRYYDAINDGRKPFEVRLNDRSFQTGDVVRLRKVSDKGSILTMFRRSSSAVSPTSFREASSASSRATAFLASVQ